MNSYDPSKIEKKWQKVWDKEKIYEAKDFSDKPKFYSLIEFPFPSGDGMHVGHMRSNTAMDVISRKRRMQGFNVLYPIGWDAFGLPTENYAIKTGKHPKDVTKTNTDNFRKQLKAAGFSFDWSREINTSDPEYYRWTQWIFLKMYEHGLAYKKKMLINWCPKDKIGLANEEVIDGKCERCGTPVEKREKEQWMLAITKYADRLDKDLDTVNYLEKIKIQQRNWIGRSEGAEIDFQIKNSKDIITVFTTRADTIFSGTFLVIAPEHPLLDLWREKISNWKEVEEYKIKTKNTPEMERMAENANKTGVEIKGITVINPATKEEMPLWTADFVIAQYGTGVVFADAHDKRDFAMAKKYSIPLKISLLPKDESKINIADVRSLKECFTEEGILINSEQFDGLTSSEARPKIVEWLASKGSARIKVQYKLRDWIFSRQRYWGEPIPMVFCETCKEVHLKSKDENVSLNAGWVPVPEKDLPVKLPDVENYQPTDTGESPLATMTKWVNIKCPVCKGPARRETDTMPNWAGSSWYFLRYADAENNKAFADPKNLKYWMEVDWYNGGMEHTTLHLLYSRFWNKFLFDMGLVPTSEPYKKRTSHGLIMAEDGEKMSKSRGNVVNPDSIISEMGADTLRLYEMFMGPFDQAVAWSTDGIVGPRRFLERIWKLQEKVEKKLPFDAQFESLIHKTVKKISEDIESMQFNTAVSALMILANEFDKKEKIAQGYYQHFLVLLAPFAPHITEEIWENLGNKHSIHLEKWMEANISKIQQEELTIVVQVNGKVRGQFKSASAITEEEASKRALGLPEVQKWLSNKVPKKVIFVKGKLVSIFI